MLTSDGWPLAAVVSRRCASRGDRSVLNCPAPDLLPHVARTRGDARANAKSEEDRRLDADQRKQPHDGRGNEHRTNASDERRGEMLDSVDKP